MFWWPPDISSSATLIPNVNFIHHISNLAKQSQLKVYSTWLFWSFWSDQTVFISRWSCSVVMEGLLVLIGFHLLTKDNQSKWICDHLWNDNSTICDLHLSSNRKPLKVPGCHKVWCGNPWSLKDDSWCFSDPDLSFSNPLIQKSERIQYTQYVHKYRNSMALLLR